MLAKIKKIVYAGSFYTVVLTAIVLIVAGIGSAGVKQSMTVRMLICFFAYGLSLAAANLLLTEQSLSMLMRCAIHGAASLAGFVVFVLCCTGYAAKHGLQSVLVSIVYLILYAAVMGIRALLLSAAAHKKAEQTQYDPKFRKHPQDKP